MTTTAETAGLIPKNICFAWDNPIDTATLTASSAVATLPVANIQDQLRSKVWRTTGCASESLIVDFGSEKFIRFFALVNSNMSTGGTVRIQLNSSNSWGSTPYDETIDAVDTGFGMGEYFFGFGGFGGLYPMTARRVVPPRVHFLGLDDTGTPPMYRYAKLTFADSTNSAGYLQFGRIYLSDYLQSPQNFAYGARQALKDPSEKTKSDGGVDWVNRKRPYAVIDLSIDRIDDANMVLNFTQFFFEVQTTQNFIFVMRPETSQGRAYFSYYGKFDDDIDFAYYFIDRSSTRICFREVPA